MEIKSFQIFKRLIRVTIHLVTDVTCNEDCPHPPSPLSQRGEGEQNPENSYSPRPLGEGLGVRVLETST